jgi:tetratricopeptide (TPR) repeat protein
LVYFNEQIEVTKSEFYSGRQARSLQLWRSLFEQYPDLVLKSEAAFNLFIDLGCHDEADALLQEARKRYPRYKLLYATIFARIAYRRGNLEEALTRYAIVRREFPEAADGYGIAAAILNDLGRSEESEAMLETGIRKLPNRIGRLL